MSRTNHAKHEHEARTAREAEEYRQRIVTRDTRRELREQVRELMRTSEFAVIDVPLALAAFS